jgi:hypothetical protein
MVDPYPHTDRSIPSSQLLAKLVDPVLDRAPPGVGQRSGQQPLRLRDGLVEVAPLLELHRQVEPGAALLG